jgi:hypothetical protein
MQHEVKNFRGFDFHNRPVDPHPRQLQRKQDNAGQPELEAAPQIKAISLGKMPVCCHPSTATSV